MSVPYNWRCKVCEQVNLANTPVCVHCGFRAVAAPIEVHAELAERTGVPLSKVEQQEYDWFASIQGAPFWKQVIFTILQAVALLCLFVIKFALFSLNGLIALIVLIFSGLALKFLWADQPIESRPPPRDTQEKQ